MDLAGSSGARIGHSRQALVAFRRPYDSAAAAGVVGAIIKKRLSLEAAPGLEALTDERRDLLSIAVT